MIKRTASGIVWYQFESVEGSGMAHAFLTRLGGASGPPYATLNLGHTVGDSLAAVEENHQRVLAALGLRREQVVSPYQVHGTHVRPVFRAHGGSVQPASDGLLTAAPGVALLLRFADCVPLVLFDARRRAVGLVHAGWNGVAGNIAAAAVSAFVRYIGSHPQDLWAGLGPAIGPCCYRVEAEIAASVVGACPVGAEVVRQRDDGLYLDLPGAVRAQLVAAGVGQVETSEVCTACHTAEWFSHRAERGRTGRFGALVMLE